MTRHGGRGHAVTRHGVDTAAKAAVDMHARALIRVNPNINRRPWTCTLAHIKKSYATGPSPRPARLKGACARYGSSSSSDEDEGHSPMGGGVPTGAATQRINPWYLASKASKAASVTRRGSRLRTHSS